MSHDIRIGTSGWNYDHWKGIIYPKELSPEAWFDHYSQLFDTVELNNTFYQQPTIPTLDKWERQAPSGFIYAMKANRYLTHMLKLKHVGPALKTQIRSARHLKSHLGPLLYQLPPNWGKDIDRLREFAKLLPKQEIHVVEFRHRDWLAGDTFELMTEFGLCLCVHDMLPRHPRRITGPAAYVRFHGPGEQKYAHQYPLDRLRAWAEWIAEASQTAPVFAYFNNDAHGHAVHDAQKMLDMLAK